MLRGRGGLDPEALQRALNAAGARRVESVDGVEGTVVEADPATLLGVADSLRRSGLFSSVERDQQVRIAEPDDPYYQSQWGLPRGGVPAAWALSSGAGVTVAVVDTGVDASHPDLQGQLLPGYDFLNDDPYPNDDNGHGTRMSGIVGAACDNGEGICGVAPGAMVLPIKSLDAQGYGPYSAVANGIIYAVDHGARIVNLSLVGTAPSSILQAAVDYAAAHDVIVVAAAGNFGTDTPGYPAASTGAVAVAAINDADGHPSFSNYGPWVSISAPGVDVVTTSPGGYAASTGTSPAAAFSSGVFALLLAANPALSRADAVARVRAGAVDLGASGWDPYFGWGRVDAYGALVPGQVGAPPPDTTPPTIGILSPTKGSLQSNMVAVDIAANDNVGVGRVELFVDNRWYATMTAPPYSFVIDAGTLEAGDHKLRAYAYDTSNNVAKTKNQKVSFTPGTGLLVTHTVVKPSSVSVSGKFALPAGVAFNPSADDVVVTLTSADGTLLSAVAKAGSFNVSGSGKMQGIMSPSVPSTGSVRLTAKSDITDQPLYTFKIRASNLSGMSARQSLMNLGIAVGGIQLSQSLPCRAKGSTLLYP
ncbi:S8 family serine peptidase [bacterium]|nr:S8 family serine peptidase [bacterium]